jgi:hypothetical protein
MKILTKTKANTQNQMHSQNQIYTVFKRILKAQTKKKNPLIVISNSLIPWVNHNNLTINFKDKSRYKMIQERNN